MIERLGELTRDDSRCGRLQDVDLGGIISKAMAEAGLRCSVDDDVVFVGCAILQARNIGAPQLADFYHEAQRRWINGQTLTLHHYRERRRPIGAYLRAILFNEPRVRVWYLFSDEEIQSRPRPMWARQKWLSRLLGLFEKAFRPGA